MKGFGVFSPSNVTSRYVLVASGLNESSGNGTPRVDASPVSLNLVDFKITEKRERATDPYSDNYDDTTNFNHYSTDTPFSFSGANFDDYMNSKSSDGIAEFSLLHSVPFNLTNGHMTTMKWIKLGPSYENEKTLLSVGTNLGDVLFYEADAFVENQSMVSTFTSNVCNVPVKCLGYCGKNMLGVAGIDGQISVVDLTDEANINVVDVSYGKWKVGLVTSLSWNYRLSHILASSGAALVPSDTSGVVVWDLKVRKPASTFRDPGGRVNPIALDWVPDQPTQLVVGYADDNAPSLQLWDLRNCSAPLTEVKSHTRGLTDLKFSPHDPNMLLTCAKDDTTKCWHLTPEKSFDLLSSIQTEALSHHSRVEWHLNAPGMFLSQANDGELCVHHAFSGKVDNGYMPIWTRKKAGVVTGFAGQVITWTSTDVHNYTLSSHYDSRTEELLDNTLEVLGVLHDEQKFSEFCDSKVATSANDHESLTWSVLKSQYHGEFRDLLDVLGYADPDRSVSDASDLLYNSDNAEGVTNAQLVGLETDEDNRTESSNFFTNRSSALTEHTTQDDKEAEDFFNSLTQKTNDLDLNASPAPERVEKREESCDEFEPESMSEELSDEYNKMNWCSDMPLRRSLVKADHYEAAERCLKLNKVVECLLLGYLGGESLFMEMASKVVKKRKDPFLNLLFMVMHNDVEGFLEYSNLRDWKETLCVLYTYTSDTSYFKELAHRFGRRLQENEMHHESSICFIISGDYREVVEAWRLCAVAEATPRTDRSGLSSMEAPRALASSLEDRLEMLLKLSVLSFSTSGSDYASDSGEVYENFDAVLMELAEVFVDAGYLEKALKTLNVTGASNSEAMTQLKSKIENQILQSQSGEEHSSPRLTYHPSTNDFLPYREEPEVSHHYTPTGPAAAYHQTTPLHQPSGTPMYQTTTPAQAYGSNARPGYQGVPSSYTPATTTPMTYQHAGLNVGPSVGMSQQMTSAPTRTVPLTAIQSTQSSVPSTHTATTAVPSSFPTSYTTSNATQYSNPTSSTNFTPYTLSHSSSNTSYGAAQQVYAPNAPVQQQSAQSYGGASSAPGAVARALNPGMPIPWPNPTPTQQISSTTVSTQHSNKLIIESTQPQPKGEKMGKSDLDMVVSTLHGLVSNLGESKVDQDNKKNVNELINSLNQGLLSAEANALLATLCRAVSNGDHFNSNVILGNIISKLWNNQNKPWIMCLKRLVPK